MSTDKPYGDPETRRRILESAWRLIAEKGAALRLGDVAAAAGVSRQSVYLHFGDRAGLLLALVQHMDDELELGPSLASVFAARSAIETIERAIELHSTFTPAIDSVARVLEAALDTDEELAAAWRDRMRFRREAHRRMVERLADEGHLAEGWTVERATDLFYALTLPVVWRELTQQLDWTAEDYVAHLTRAVRSTFLAG